MLLAKFKDTVVTINGPGIVVSITYPLSFMAVNAYYAIREACERFNKEPDLNPDYIPKIYAFGEMYTWTQYLKRLCLTAEKVGAKIQLKSTEE